MDVYEFYIPVAKVDDALAYLAGAFGGASALPGVVRGTWLDRGKLVADELTRIAVGVSNPDAVPSVARFIAGRIGETAIYVVETGSTAEVYMAD